MKIHETMLHANQWTKRAFARLPDGMATSVSDPCAVSFCLTGWVLRCYPDYFERVDILSKIKDKLGHPGVFWNDVFTRTFEEVQNLTKELDI